MDQLISAPQTQVETKLVRSILLDIFPGRLEDLNNYAFGFTAEDAPRSSNRILEPWSVSKLKRSEGFRVLQASDLKMSSSVGT
ncbi:hypothetical protein GGR27_001124 [Lewinella antarctica]|uniref:Uncharacterized protein n=1 Tax=Neolewinella antarctica TaxID=442734 RepID=A0ABX0X9D2_9BACT|nr:hypothetical protein [Neolewinella antarctica]